MDESILDVWEFRHWLDAKPNVGTPRSAQSCPVAQYLKEVTGKTHHVGMNGIGVGGINHHHAASWISPFIREVDKLPGTVSAKQALAILDRI